MKQTNFKFEVEAGSENTRIDKFLAEKLPDTSRSQIQLLIEAAQVTLNEGVIQKTGIKVKEGDVVEILLTEDAPDGLVPEAIPLGIIYEDDHVIVINKPSGLVVHPGAGNFSGTVVNGLLHHFPPIRHVGEPDRPGVVHRLDKDTSGVLIFAKTEKAYRWLVKQFKSRDLSKTYLALVDGHPPTPTGRIEAPIERDTHRRTRMAVGLRGQGKPAVSEYFEVERFENHSLLEVHPITGRTHQIRVHLSYLGVPVVGDTLYGRRNPTIKMAGFFLHAKALSIKLPGDRAPRSFEAPLPDDMTKILYDLRSNERTSL